MNFTDTASARLPTIYGHFKIIVYNCMDGLEHIVLLKGKNTKGPTMVRIHSQCVTGDIFSSLRCDCREQLVLALKRIGKAKSGVIIYLNQEGRSIGLTNKIKTYKLQEQGFDTVEANKKLKLPIDGRTYKIAADILKDLGILHIKLMTNNLDKVEQLKQEGIKVTRTPLEVQPNNFNKHYLKTKKSKLKHKLNLV